MREKFVALKVAGEVALKSLSFYEPEVAKPYSFDVYQCHSRP